MAAAGDRAGHRDRSPGRRCVVLLWPDIDSVAARRLEEKGPGTCQAGRIQLDRHGSGAGACRAGTKASLSRGPTLPAEIANTRRSGWRTTTQVKTFPANPLGLYDVHGNVWEWCGDWYGSQYYADSPPIDPKGLIDSARRVV